MNKGLIGFFTGIFVLIVSFFITVSIVGEVHGNGGFVGEVQSWGNSQQEEQLPEDTEQESQINITDNSIVIK